MPKSKHRRKTGGKAVKKPGKHKTVSVRGPHLPPNLLAWLRFSDRYRDAIPEDLDEATEDMVNLILEAAFGFESGRIELQPVSKSAIFKEFTHPFDRTEVEASVPDLTVEDGEAALAFLLARDMIAVDGDVITLPARFVAAQGEGASPGNPAETTP